MSTHSRLLIAMIAANSSHCSASSDVRSGIAVKEHAELHYCWLVHDFDHNLTCEGCAFVLLCDSMRAIPSTTMQRREPRHSDERWQRCNDSCALFSSSLIDFIAHGTENVHAVRELNASCIACRNHAKRVSVAGGTSSRLVSCTHHPISTSRYRCCCP